MKLINNFFNIIDQLKIKIDILIEIKSRFQSVQKLDSDLYLSRYKFN